jgi:uncharacterized membrane protein YqhA
MTRPGEPEDEQGPRPGGDTGLPGPVGTGFERALLGSRMLALIPVIVLLLASAAAFVYDAVLFAHAVAGVVHGPFPQNGRAGELLAVIDLFLVGATTLISALGFYELFIGVSPGVRERLPGWLVMRDLDDLKARVVSMLILVAAAAFVDAVVNYNGGHDILYFGIAVAVVIGALTAYLRYGAGRRSD